MKAITIAIGLISLFLSSNTFAITRTSNMKSVMSVHKLLRVSTEINLQGLDLEDSDLTFKQLGGTTKTNWGIKRNGKYIANLKCSGGNTNYNAAIAAYEFSKLLKLPLTPVAVKRWVNFRLRYKSRTGRYTSMYLRRYCALKEWVSNQAQYYWSRRTFTGTTARIKRKLRNHLKCQYRKSTQQTFHFRTYTKYGSPSAGKRTRYLGKMDFTQTAKDFSNIMLLDVILGNNDRFPGGNLHIKSYSNLVDINRRKGEVFFNHARLFALDNEASFWGVYSNALKDMRKFLGRFDMSFVTRLQDLKSDLEDEDISMLSAKYKFLDFYLRARLRGRRVHAVKHVLTNLRWIFKHIAKRKKKCHRYGIDL